MTAALREAAEKARDQFQYYANEHATAGKLEKAATNQRFADLLTTALAEPGETVPVTWRKAILRWQ